MERAIPSPSVSIPKSGENSWLWLYKLLSGPFILILILVHFVVNHAIAATGLLGYKDVLVYYQVWIVPIMEIVFLALVVSHSLLGVRSILLDLKPSRGALSAINWIFLVVGAVAFVYGTWLILTIVSRGVGM